MKDRRRKPRGTIGVTTVHLDGSGTEFTRVVLPETKEEIEFAIVHAAFKPNKHLDLTNFYCLTQPPERLREADHDFRLHTVTGPKYLELLEAALLEPSRGSYERASYAFNLGEKVDAVYAMILRKVEKYGRTPSHSLHLLLYSTDWHFSLAGSGGDLLAHVLERREHCFATVVYCEPSPERDPGAGLSASSRILFPLSKKEIGSSKVRR